jgi:uncharacterized membrane-anchored protein
MRKAIVLLAGVAILALVNVTVAQRERLLRDGRVVLLELAPVDPRSLLQGDYMALEFRAALEARQAKAIERTTDGRLVLALDDRGVGRFVRRDDGSPLADREVLLRYRVRDGRVKLVTNAWFFEEGQGERYASARYGEFRVAPDGDALLATLRAASLERIGP